MGKFQAYAMLASEIRVANNQLITTDRRYWTASVSVLLLGGVIWPYLTATQTLLSVAGLISVSVMMSGMAYLFQRDKQHNQHAEFWEKLLISANLISGAVSGVITAWLYLELPPQTANLVLLITLLIIGGRSIANLPSMKCVNAFFLPATIPLLFALGAGGTTEGHIIAVVVFLYFLALHNHARRVSTAYRNSVEFLGRLEAQADAEKRDKEAAQQEGERLNRIYEMLPVPVIIVEHATTRLLYANRTALDLMGLKELQESFGKLGKDFLKHPEEERNILRNLIVKDGVSSVEFQLKRADGHDFWAFATVKAMTYEGRRALIATIADITQRREAEEALRKSEEKFHLLTENAHDLISYYAFDGMCSYVSPSIEKVLGYSQDAFTGQHVTDYIHPEDIDTVLSSNTKCMKAGGGAVQYIYRVRHRLGHWEWLEASTTPIKDPDSGKFTHFASVSRLVTDRIRHEQELKEARERAESADRAKSAFLANMSHEIRTPLNAIIGFSEVMRDELFGPLGSPRYQEYMNDIHDSGIHLLALINDVLDLSKVEAGKLELQEDRVLLGSLVDTVLRLLREKAESKFISLQSRFSMDPYIWCDRRVITQVLLNIIGNAIKFTPERGRVTVETRMDQEGNLLLSVTDTGIGIGAEDLVRVMQPFQQARIHSTVAQKEPGTGLGLTLSRSFIEKHGGALTIQSELELGTRVTILLPASRVLDDNEEMASAISVK